MPIYRNTANLFLFITIVCVGSAVLPLCTTGVRGQLCLSVQLYMGSGGWGQFVRFAQQMATEPSYQPSAVDSCLVVWNPQYWTKPVPVALQIFWGSSCDPRLQAPFLLGCVGWNRAPWSWRSCDSGCGGWCALLLQTGQVHWCHFRPCSRLLFLLQSDWSLPLACLSFSLLQAELGLSFSRCCWSQVLWHFKLVCSCWNCGPVSYIFITVCSCVKYLSELEKVRESGAPDPVS